MPTHFENPSFLRDLERLTPAQVSLFEVRLRQFVADLADIEDGRLSWFRSGLRVKKVKGVTGVYEMTWAPDGRATFAWGPQQTPGKRHVVWLRIGSHDILP